MDGRIIITCANLERADERRRLLESDSHDVLIARDGRAAIDEARRRRPDLVVADLAAPVVGGLDLCRILRYEDDVPIVLTGGADAVPDLLLGLELGADDYLVEPLDPSELVARARAVLRRTRCRRADLVHEIGDLRVDTVRYEVHLANELIAVTPAEFRLLVALAAAPGRAFDRRSLIEATFGFDYDGLERTIDVHIANLRKKIDQPADPQLLLTVFGVGYRLAEAQPTTRG